MYPIEILSLSEIITKLTGTIRQRGEMENIWVGVALYVPKNEEPEKVAARQVFSDKNLSL